MFGQISSQPQLFHRHIEVIISRFPTQTLKTSKVQIIFSHVKKLILQALTAGQLQNLRIQMRLRCEHLK